MYFSASCCCPMFARRDGHGPRSRAEVRIELDRLHESSAAPPRICCRTWLPCPSRSRGRRRATRPTACPWRSVARSPTCRRRAPCGRRSPARSRRPRTWSLRSPLFRRRGDDVAGHRLRRLHRNAVAGALAVRRAREHDAEALLDGDLARRPLVERLGRPHAKGARDAGAVVRADEARTFQRELQRRLQRAVEGGVARAVLEIGDQH